VGSLTVSEIKRKLTTLLARDYLVNPQLDVKVQEYNSQYVWVVGEVNSPGRKPLRGTNRLIDVLLECGGLRPNASGEVTITRADPAAKGGARNMTVRLSGAGLTPQEQVNLEIPLRSGDIITLSPRAFVDVQGEVNRPNRYQIEADLTITGAISMAGGLTRFGGSDVEIRRKTAGSDKNQILKVSLKAIRKGKATDVVLMPSDVITVPRRLF
jgi:polysaccharide export outer membrane protein